MLIEMHLLKNHTPANLNRDETGSPKDCIFGGVPRARISSQCLKRSIRKSDIFQEAVDKELIGIRTRKMPQMVGAVLRERGISEQLVVKAEMVLSNLGKKEEKPEKDSRTKKDDKPLKESQTEQILFYSNEDIRDVANVMEKIIQENGNDLSKFEKIKFKDLKDQMKGKRPISVDIAMFGRMVTDSLMHNVEASVQVAHAISTNRLQREFDYFTAVDDLLEANDEIGAAMIGDLEFNSSCFYEYINFDMEEFIKNLSVGREDEKQKVREIAEKVIVALLEASVFTTPTGKQNTFAAHQLPLAVYVEIKSRKIPVSMANAFIKPAEASRGKGLDEDSLEKMVAHIDTVNRKFFGQDSSGNRLWFSTLDNINPETAQVCDSLKDLKGKIQAALNKE